MMIWIVAALCGFFAGLALVVLLVWLAWLLAEHCAPHVERGRSAGVAKSWSGCFVRHK